MDPEGEVITWLNAHKLGMYAASVVEDMGYEQMDMLLEQTDDELATLADKAGMKSAHTRMFLKHIKVEKEKAVIPLHQWPLASTSSRALPAGQPTVCWSPTYR